MNSLCTEVGFYSLNKWGEQTCGDRVEVVEHSEEQSTVVVLADGLGSGVKANILSTLTAKIISTMIAQRMSLEDCVMAIAATLPVCEVRGIAYSTFTIIHITENRYAEIIQYDNPHVILLRQGKNVLYPEIIESIGDKTIYKSRIALQENDTFIAMSDGVVHAGVGKCLNFGWMREDIIEFLERLYKAEYSAKALSTILLEQCEALYGGEPGDDTTVCTVKIRERVSVNLLLGPPQYVQDDAQMLSLFFAKEGRHIVCGGTTSTMAARFLGKELVADINGYHNPGIPPMAKIEGVDLVTEGVITISQVLEYSKDYLGENSAYTDWSRKTDGASQIARMLFEEATDINFYVGRAINPAHQNPDLPIGFSIKMRLVEELSQMLKQMGKRIKVSYF